MGGGTDDDALALRLNAADAGRGRRQDARDVLPVHATGVHHCLNDDRQGRLQTRHAKRSGLPLAVLHLEGMRGMVRTNDVDRAIREALTHRLDVLRAAQRGVHLVERIVGGGQLLGEQQVVRGHLGGNVHPLGLPPAHNVD